MRTDWIGALAFLAGCSALAGLAAYRGTDREAGRMLIVVGAIVALLAAVEWCAAAWRARWLPLSFSSDT